ncbi:type IV pili methyl-accepting chemotaxis transducer N-terminal domain-containing protein [Pseudomonas sp. MBLB4136]|uniref:type IV pili methyl-accepting chemotaxis transducer N-terminal domain-containing protein n=1 Tax=Pseudomonas sp. MBLB4136 TaxID=3451558 RepID=UPI003F74B6FF
MYTSTIATLLLALTLLSSPAWAAIGAAEAMNLSGMQRMLSQRIAKSYLMIGAGVRPDVAAHQLDQSIARFESNYLTLSEYAPTAPIRTALNAAGDTWQQYRELALSQPSRQNALGMLELSDRLLAQSEHLVSLLEQHSGGHGARLVNRSGRQRMLSQRIAKLYLAMSWRLPVAGLEETFAQATREFDLALQELQQASQNTTEIAASLKRAEAQWRFTRAGFDLSADSRYVPTVVSTTTETLLWQMNDLTQAYENLMAEG